MNKRCIFVSIKIHERLKELKKKKNYDSFDSVIDRLFHEYDTKII